MGRLCPVRGGTGFCFSDLGTRRLRRWYWLIQRSSGSYQIGFVVLRGGFARNLAAACRDFVWEQVRLWDQCTTYGQPMVQLQKVFNCSPFDKIMNDRLRSALDALVGPGNWREPPGYGWWSLLFPGATGPGGWHVDGGQFRVSGSLTDLSHALVTLFLFSDAGPGD